MAAAASIAQVARKADRAAAAARIVASGDVIVLANGSGWVVTDRTGSGKAHIATATSCDCRDFEFRGHRQSCKHVQAVRAALGVVSCPACGAICVREAHYVGGRGYRSFDVCTADREHPAQPAE